MNVSVGYQIFPLGDSVDTTRTGTVYYRRLNARDRTKNLRGILSRNFDRPNSEFRLLIVITFYKIPQIGSGDPSIVSHQTIF